MGYEIIFKKFVPQNKNKVQALLKRLELNFHNANFIHSAYKRKALYGITK